MFLKPIESKNNLSKTMQNMQKNYSCKFCNKKKGILDIWRKVCKAEECQLKQGREKNDKYLRSRLHYEV